MGLWWRFAIYGGGGGREVVKGWWLKWREGVGGC